MVTAAEHEDLLKAAVGLSAGEFPIQAKYNPKFFEVEADRDERLRSCQMVDTASEDRFSDITTYEATRMMMAPCSGGRTRRSFGSVWEAMITYALRGC